MTAAIGKLNVLLTADISKFSQALKNAGARFAKIGSQLKSVGKSMSLAVSAPLAAVGTSMLKAAGNFEKSMNRVRAVTGEMDIPFEKLQGLAQELGSSTEFSASQAADALGFLAQAGFKASEQYAALPGVLNLAAAGQLELAEAADIASNVMSGYGFRAEEIGRINDVLAKTFTSTNTSLGDLGQAFSYVAPTAKSAGLEFEEISAAIGLLGNAGIQATRAGTGLNAAIASLLSPAAQAQAVLDRLGVTVRDSTTGNMLPLVEILRQLEQGGATTADVMAIFGKNTGPKMAALLGQGSGALEALTQKLRESGGTADQVAAQQRQGLNAAMTELASAWEGLSIAIGQSGIAEKLTEIIKQVTAFVQEVSKTNPELLQMGFLIGAAVVAIGPLLIVLGSLLALIPLIGAAFAALAGPVGLVIATFAAVGAAIWTVVDQWDAAAAGISKTWETLQAGASSIWGSILGIFKDFWGSVARLFETGGEIVSGTWSNLWEAASTTASVIWGGITSILSGAWDMLGSGLSSFAGVVSSAWSSLWQGVSSLVSSSWGVITSTVSTGMQAVVSAMQSVTGTIRGIWDGITSIIKGAINSVVAAINGFISGINSIQIQVPVIEIPYVGTFGGFTIGMPQIPTLPMLAEGGIVTQATALIAGEKGAEAIIPLDQLNAMLSSQSGAGGATVVNQYYTIAPQGSIMTENAMVDLFVDRILEKGRSNLALGV